VSAVRGLAGLLALGAAAFVAPSGDSAPRSEPLAAALAPLGPVKSLASSFLWHRLLLTQQHAEGERAATLGRALLELHPDLRVVRIYVATQLVISEAVHAPDLARHDRLVSAGLALLSDGLALQDSAELHGALGRLLAVQRDNDPEFRVAAEAWLGDDLDATVIFHLRRSEGTVNDRTLLARWLLERGEAELRDNDPWAARRDWQEAAEAYAPLESDEPVLVDQCLQRLAQELRDRGISPADVGPLPERR
jgi:hypothetical protein